ncbi:DUF58 domain-containing protein [Nocardioides sp.]|uniref:DUF58 domain-containing protein n=1 Tax=Nocardioides sp. TaxID=35761 RepID=UPI00356397DC
MATITAQGRAVIAVTLLAWAAFWWLGWMEFGVVAAFGGCLLGAALVLVALPQPARALVRLAPDRVSAGESARAVISVRAGWLPLLSPTIRIEVAGDTRSLRLPLVPPRGERSETIEVPPLPRGVHLIGPVRHLRNDALGLLRVRRSWAGAQELLVRPRLTRLREFDPGLISDLDGVPSDHPASSDLAFHALREYVRGDDLRHVHWRSSAKADTLLVRQYVETRRSEAAIVLDDRPSAYADEAEFEVAVSVAASLAVRALRDDFEVSLICGDLHVSSRSPDVVLDAACRITQAEEGDLRHTAKLAAHGSASSLVALVSGSGCDPALLRTAGAEFPPDALRLLVRVDVAVPSTITTVSGFRPVVLGRLEDLGVLLAGSGVSA